MTLHTTPAQFERQMLLERSAPAPRAIFTSFRFEVIDEEVFRTIERGVFQLRGVLRLCVPWTEPVTVALDGTAFLRLTPVDADPDALDVTLAILDAVLADRGAEASPVEETDRWRRPGERFAKEALSVEPADVFEEWTGRRAAFVRQIADRLRHSYGLPLEAIREIVGPVVLPSRTLWPSADDASQLGHDAARLDAEESAKQTQRAAAAAAAEVARLEALREVTLDEAGMDVVAVDESRIGGSTPWQYAAELWQDERRKFFGCKRILGLELPAYSLGGVEVLPGTAKLPVGLERGIEPNHGFYELACHLRRTNAKGLDLAPIDDGRWTDAGVPQARELAKSWAAIWLSFNQAAIWRQRWLCGLIVRGLLVRPDLAESVVRDAIEQEDSRRPQGHPIPQSWLGPLDRAIGRAGPAPSTVNEVAAAHCLAAAAADDHSPPVSAGGLLDTFQPTRNLTMTTAFRTDNEYVAALADIEDHIVKMNEARAKNFAEARKKFDAAPADVADAGKARRDMIRDQRTRFVPRSRDDARGRLSPDPTENNDPSDEDPNGYQAAAAKVRAGMYPAEAHEATKTAKPANPERAFGTNVASVAAFNALSADGARKAMIKFNASRFVSAADRKAADAKRDGRR